MGLVPERIDVARYFIDKGELHPLVYVNKIECVGIVVEHNNHKNKQMGKHENGVRISYEELLIELTKHDEYKYTGYIMKK